MSDEETRILLAARDGRLSVNASGRYVIEGEPRPERKARERCLRREWIAFEGYKFCSARLTITALGEQQLHREGHR